MHAQIDEYKLSISFKYHRNKNIVLVGGVFDILHLGHIHFLTDAKKHGEYLVIALEPDEHIIKYKKRIPIHTQRQRAMILSSLRIVDHIIMLPFLKEDEDYYELVKNIKPNVIALTMGDSQFYTKCNQAKLINAKIRVLDFMESFSTTKILNVNTKEIIKQESKLILNKLYKNKITIDSTCNEYAGIVEHGLHAGRKLGFPTANIYVDQFINDEGVYDCNILLEERMYNGIAYYDKRRPNVLEAHLFNKIDDFYGVKIKIILNFYLRQPVETFSKEVMEKIIKQDIECIAKIKRNFNYG
ncbi:FAD synthase [Astathelohania contejeani]|uniref:riboflavin kinase n=1 Tax=Astathelohania contejeani TaxID=164912 RepID=A0ABQ7HZZ4_9MICR|nr:FAD synthase [Thelohania contejeani]